MVRFTMHLAKRQRLSTQRIMNLFLDFMVMDCWVSSFWSSLVKILDVLSLSVVSSLVGWGWTSSLFCSGASLGVVWSSFWGSSSSISSGRISISTESSPSFALSLCLSSLLWLTSSILSVEEVGVGGEILLLSVLTNFGLSVLSSANGLPKYLYYVTSLNMSIKVLMLTI